MTDRQCHLTAEIVVLLRSSLVVSLLIVTVGDSHPHYVGPLPQPSQPSMNPYNPSRYTPIRPVSTDAHRLCYFWSTVGQCDRNPSYMCVQCVRSCYSYAACVAQRPLGPPSQGRTPLTSPGSRGAKDYHLWCCFWAQYGQCYSNPKFMCPFCQKSCGTLGCRATNYWLYTPTLNTHGCPFYR